ncbi:MAG: hypothetical protein Ct9H90mP9_4000 [Pseudomonadota bacterium]|nr:MAG: hypothetical protein Ct9H90mP9_4000 [Pseudomonadota bacterium]
MQFGKITEPLEEEFGISMGVGFGDWAASKNNQNSFGTGAETGQPLLHPDDPSNLAPGQVSMLFRARNYSACSVSACASSNHAIGTAMRHIERGMQK